MNLSKRLKHPKKQQMVNSEIDNVVKTIKRGYLKCNLLKYGGAIALGFVSARLYRCCIAEDPNSIAILCCIVLMFLSIAIIVLSFKCRQSIIRHTEETLNDIVFKQAEISFQLSNTDDNDYVQKQRLKQEEAFLNEALRKLFSTLP